MGPVQRGTCWRPGLQWWWNATLILPGAAAGRVGGRWGPPPRRSCKQSWGRAGAVSARHGTIVLPGRLAQGRYRNTITAVAGLPAGWASRTATQANSHPATAQNAGDSQPGRSLRRCGRREIGNLLPTLVRASGRRRWRRGPPGGPERCAGLSRHTDCAAYSGQCRADAERPIISWQIYLPDGPSAGRRRPTPSRHRAVKRTTASRGGLTAASRAGERAICFPPQCERAGGRVGGQMQADYSQAHCPHL